MGRKFFVIAILFFLAGCNDKVNTHTKHEVMTVTSQPISTSLFYSGIIQPLKTIVVTSPSDGVIDGMLFHYGDTVTSRQLLFTITSGKFQSDYKTALMAYIKAKTEFSNSENQLKEGEFLHKNQLISDDDYKTKQTNFYNSRLALLQTKDALSTLIKQLDVQGFNPYDLSIEDVDKITRALQVQNNSQTLQVMAPVSGVVLLPMKNDSDTDIKKITKGEQVKQGDLLAMIGDLSGLTIHVDVNEFNINQIHAGQKVKITGIAFPDFVLQGQIAGIDRQGQMNQGGVPVFPVEVIVPSLTKEQQNIIHAGMSAKVEIDMESQPEITVPISAVKEKNGLAYVEVKNDKTGKLQERLVKTGKTTENGVVIADNLKEGEQIVLTD
jgi:multidrug efflux pump subunit AcrA (membrane-fusion protein)